MKITPIYKNRLITLPAETVLQKLSTATKEELAVLIAVIAEPEFDVKEICQKLDISTTEKRSPRQNLYRRVSQTPRRK